MEFPKGGWKGWKGGKIPVLETLSRFRVPRIPSSPPPPARDRIWPKGMDWRSPIRSFVVIAAPLLDNDTETIIPLPRIKLETSTAQRKILVSRVAGLSFY